MEYDNLITRFPSQTYRMMQIDNRALHKKILYFYY